MRKGVIKKGYKLTVTDKDGIVQDVIELEGLDLNIPGHKQSLADDIRDGLPIEAFEGVT